MNDFIQVGARVRCIWKYAPSVMGKTAVVVIAPGPDRRYTVRWDDPTVGTYCIDWNDNGDQCFEPLDEAEVAHLEDLQRRHEHAMRYL